MISLQFRFEVRGLQLSLFTAETRCFLERVCQQCQGGQYGNELFIVEMKLTELVTLNTYSVRCCADKQSGKLLRRQKHHVHLIRVHPDKISKYSTLSNKQKPLLLNYTT